MKNSWAERWQRHVPKIIFALSFAAGYFLVPQIVVKEYWWLTAAFLITFALSMACIFAAIAEKMKNRNDGKEGGMMGAVSLFASILGFAALEACGLAFSCSAAGIGIVSIIVPSVAMHYISQYAAYVVAASVALQLIAMHKMGCFRNGTLAKMLM